MACIDCGDNCGDIILSDRCVRYTGPDVPSLDICTNDMLFEVEAKLIAGLSGITSGTTIVLPDLLLGCQFLTTFFDSNEKTLSNYIQILLDRVCYQDANIIAINDIIFAPFSINAPCLGLAPGSTRDQAIAATATKVCAVDTQVAAITADYVKNSELCAKVTTCLSGAATQQNTKMVPYVAYPYHGPISNFDAAGIGLSASGFDKVYICNGQTIGVFVTPDYRGRSPIGNNVGIPGGALDSNVNPALPANTGYNITSGVKVGSYTNTLTVNQIPSHNHSVTDPGHTHPFVQTHANSYTGSPTSIVSGSGSVSPVNYTFNTSSGITNISIAAIGGGQPHNSTHPSIGCNFIMYIP